MSDSGEPMQAEHNFKKVVWRSTLDLSHSLERYTNWSIGGVAVIIGLFIGNIESVSKIVSLEADSKDTPFAGSQSSWLSPEPHGPFISSGRDPKFPFS